jgi:glycosyltransferase involved in cell wall biosynthesis
MVVHFIEDLSPISGGVASVVSMLCRELPTNNICHTIICNKAINVDIPDNIDVNVFIGNKRSFGWGYSREMCDFINEISRRPNTIFHVHGVWKAIHFFAVKIAHKNNIPCILTPHGMLNTWMWNSQGITKKVKKKLYWFIFSRHFRKVDLLHAITPDEQEYLKRLFPNTDIVKLPNAISMGTLTNLSETFLPPQKYVLFLGRVHPVKGLDILVRAFNSEGLKDSFRLIIVGPIDDEEYWQSICNYIDDNNLSDYITYLGTKFGEDKDTIIAQAWVCAVPSSSEVIGMVNLEAANLRCPSITTFETGLHDWEDGGGLLVKADSASSCSKALKRAKSWSLEERLRRGNKSYDLVDQKYNISKIKQDWNSIYEKLIINNKI